MLAKEQARIRQQYEDRLRELESERQSVQEDKAQVGEGPKGGGTGLGCLPQQEQAGQDPGAASYRQSVAPLPAGHRLPLTLLPPPPPPWLRPLV